jgi:small-conductance mechanosensitive channel
MNIRRSSNQAVLLVSKITYWTVMLLGTITSLQQVGFNLTAFLTGLGIVGFTVGFALQDVSKNFVSGLLLLIQHPFYVGDAIEVSGFSGRVMSIDLRSTELHTWDGRVVIIPNADVFTKPITNFSRAAMRRAEITGSVAFPGEIEQVRDVAIRSLEDIYGLVQDPPPSLTFTSVGKGTGEFTLHFWINMRDTVLEDARDQGLLALKDAFESAGVEMPTPPRATM